MSAAENIFQHILEEPYDDDVRLHYSDAVDDDELREFIILQVSGNLGIRMRELLEKNRTRWLGPLNELVIDAGFRRGLVTSVTMDAEVFMFRGTEIFAQAPVLDFRLTNLKENLGGVRIQDDVLQNLRSLDVRSNDLDDKDVLRITQMEFEDLRSAFMLVETTKSGP